MNRRTDRRILKIFLPGFWIQSKILTDARILQLQRIADSFIFGTGFWTLRVFNIFLPGFRIQGEILTADLHTPIHPPPAVCRYAFEVSHYRDFKF